MTSFPDRAIPLSGNEANTAAALGFESGTLRPHPPPTHKRVSTPPRPSPVWVTVANTLRDDKTARLWRKARELDEPNGDWWTAVRRDLEAARARLEGEVAVLALQVNDEL